LDECFLANIALKWPISGVNSDMIFKIPAVGKCFLADHAGIWFFSSVCVRMWDFLLFSWLNFLSQMSHEYGFHQYGVACAPLDV